MASLTDHWYYSTGSGDTHGPMPSAELIEAAKRGILTESGMVYHAGRTNGQWINAVDIPAIRSAIDGRAAILGRQSIPPPAVEPPPISVIETRERSRSTIPGESQLASIFPHLESRALRSVLVVAAVTLAITCMVAMGSVLAAFEGEGNFQRGVVLTVAAPFLMAPLFAMYMMPTIVAYVRYHTNWIPIGIINLAVGWTGFLWILLLAWSMGSTVAPPQEPEAVFE